MPNYIYKENDLGIMQTIFVEIHDVSTIENLHVGSTVVLRSGHEVKVINKDKVEILCPLRKNSTTTLSSLKSGLVK